MTVSDDLKKTYGHNRGYSADKANRINRLLMTVGMGMGEIEGREVRRGEL